jgi:hypothetical protein
MCVNMCSRLGTLSTNGSAGVISAYPSASCYERPQEQVRDEASDRSARPLIGVPVSSIVARRGLGGLPGRIKMRCGGCLLKIIPENCQGLEALFRKSGRRKRMEPAQGIVLCTS